MHVRNFTFALFAALLMGQQVHAGPASDAAQRAETLLSQGQTAPAYSAFNTAVHAFWQSSPLAFRKSMLVERAGGFGDYDLRAGSDFRSGDTLTVYAEPVGFGIARQSGQFEIGFETDFRIENATGQILAASDDLFSVKHRSWSQNRDFNMTLSLVIPNLKPSPYVGVFTVKDQVSGKTGQFRIPFNITK
jgi:hypothetical protein